MAPDTLKTSAKVSSSKNGDNSSVKTASTTFTYQDAVAAASRSAARGATYVLRAMDCEVLACWDSGRGSVCVSSPNTKWIPEVPTHREHRTFSYFADGMLGPFELMKWPQVYDAMYPHSCAAPLNPALPLPVCDDRDMPVHFKDTAVPWMQWSPKLLEEWSRTSSATIGCLAQDVKVRLQQAHSEVDEMVAKIAAELPKQSKRPVDGDKLDPALQFAERLLSKAKSHDVHKIPFCVEKE
ncbi:hypothetical protein FA95DRAFT_1612688 [Auriscalpium vulgare]|uniref:Uncharacterized protein n=1 Tax=Auriscalpium vulgare TaxID=40419 RepID=A0ACB8R5G8_9AGAM|nr:hypothetical protein FA95DRAFT_1612688 [Auriscalpium vulgare]